MSRVTRRSAEGDEGTARCMECEIGDAFERKGARRNGAGGFARNGAMQSSEWEVEDGVDLR
jgi:hypothetical protein